ncbi:hypothetical protein BGP77_16895 [Saccharospirillum sp. MSK14-1]|uniref:type IV pilin protein n=1 Tax=Saccharospirillum sp. MSK14-1 TaxID=1897632 RepID=UPI000D33B9BE|nr:type IV pilin protein [Saccharospirillum sp. MSK14-1]PTY38125.1 hypothetical protein BGP77_16895 [Saccharospirillum sp. MSK14-1]
MLHSSIPHRTQWGFTLVEIMLALAILALLTAIALPNYQQQVRQARRSDAHVLLFNAANVQQQLWVREMRYSESPAELSGVNSPQGFYQLTTVLAEQGELMLTNPVGIQVLCSGDPCFTLAATPAKSQTPDDLCAVFTLDHLGRKRSYNQSGQQNDPGPDDPCW